MHSLRISVLAAATIGLMLLVGCATSTDEPGNQGLSLSTSLPMRALNEMYASRTAMISLADGSAEDPAAAFDRMKQAMPVLEAFDRKMEKLGDSFDDSDYLHFWNTLSGFGSIYQINTGGIQANRLRSLEMNLRSFETDVHTLDRVYSTYMERLRQLMDVLGEETSIEEVQQHVPLVNSITEITVELDVYIRDFSENLFELGRKLRSMA